MPSPFSPLGRWYPAYRRVRKAAVESAVALGTFPAAAFRSRKRGRAGPEPRRILVVALLKIGDTLTTLPAAGLLRRRFPGAEIALWVRSETAPLVSGAPGIDRVFTGASLASLREVRRWKADLALVASFVPQHLALALLARARRIAGYDDHGRGPLVDLPARAPWQIGKAVPDYPAGARILHQTEVVSLLAEAAGAEGPPAPPRLAVAEEARLRVARLLEGPPGGHRPGGPRILLHPWNDQPNYRWPLGRWGALGARLADEGARLCIGGRERDLPEARRLATLIARERMTTVLAGELSLAETAALVERMDLVVSVDTMATHLAGALGVPVVALFGPGSPAIWRPLGSPARAIQSTAVCHGCRLPLCFRARHECMEGISVDEAFSAATALLVERRATNDERRAAPPA